MTERGVPPAEAIECGMPPTPEAITRGSSGADAIERGTVPVEAIEGSFQETKERGAAEAGAAAGAATLDELGQKIEDTLLAGELQARAELASKRGP